MIKITNSKNVRSYLINLIPKLIMLNGKYKKIDEIKQKHLNLYNLNINDAFQGYKKLLNQANQLFKDECQEIILKQQLTPPIPGLIYYRNIFTPNLSQLQNYSINLYKILLSKQKQIDRTHVSYNHNLSSNKIYKLINIQDNINQQKINKTHKIDASYFKNYGSIGHDLTYFIDNKNIPYYIQKYLINKLEEMEIVKKLQNDKKSQLNWRLTFNVYKQNNQVETSFLWHKDIAANGIITSISTILGQGLFQIRHQTYKQISYKVPTKLGSLVILSGQSRNNWEHRVLRQIKNTSDEIKNIQESNESQIQRISLVLGCK